MSLPLNSAGGSLQRHKKPRAVIWELLPLYLYSDFGSGFQGPAHSTVFITGFSLCRRGKIAFSGGMVSYLFFVLWAFRVGFLFLAVHVYSED